MRAPDGDFSFQDIVLGDQVSADQRLGCSGVDQDVRTVHPVYSSVPSCSVRVPLLLPAIHGSFGAFRGVVTPLIAIETRHRRSVPALRARTPGGLPLAACRSDITALSSRLRCRAVSGPVPVVSAPWALIDWSAVFLSTLANGHGTGLQKITANPTCFLAVLGLSLDHGNSGHPPSVLRGTAPSQSDQAVHLGTYFTLPSGWLDPSGRLLTPWGTHLPLAGVFETSDGTSPRECHTAPG